MLYFRRVTSYMGFMLFIIFIYFIFKGFTFYFNSTVIFLEWEIFSIFSCDIVMTLLLDWMSLTFMGFVSFISSMVLIYSGSYMQGDKFIYRFIMLVFLFVLSMLLLIVSPNMISILLGWDGLGLVSYCLVIYYQNVKSANAGMLTILSNRVGDVAILLSISWLANYGSWNFFYLQFMYSKNELFFILAMVVLAAMTKSAQIPFSAWLPAAMAAPTPVSALVHSSTLVTAGVYLLIRFHTLINVNNFLLMVGCFTMVMSGLGANFETDLKKIIALSTLSQLGVMMFVLSLGSYELAFFHLLSHALFKSLLFLCAGVFIHSMGDIQDIRFLGGLEKGCPLSSFYFVGCSLSLCGFPFLSGFYSKDAILEYYFMGECSWFILLFVILGSLFTATYSVRLGYFLYLKNLGLKSLVHLEEEVPMALPMSFLFCLAMVAGSAMSWLYFPCHAVILSLFFKVLILILIFLFSFFIFKIMGLFSVTLMEKTSLWLHFLGSMWFMPLISTASFMPLLGLGKIFVKYLDQGWMEYLGSQGKLYGGLIKYSAGLGVNYFLGVKSYLFFFFMLVIYLILSIF